MRRLICCTQLVSASWVAIAFAMPVVAAPSTMGDEQSIVKSTPSALSLPGGRGFSITGDLRTLYDSNILRRGDGVPLLPGDNRSDVRFSPAVSAEFGMPVGRQQLYLSGTVGRDYFVNNKRLNSNRYQIAGGAALAAGSSCTANLDVDLAERVLLLSDVGLLVPNAIQTFNYGAAANCASAVGLGFGGNVRRSQVRNDNITRAGFDLNSTAYGAQLNYRLGGIGAFSLSGNLNNVSYINRPILLPGGGTSDDGVRIISGRVGFERDLGSRLALTLGLSYFESQPEPTTILQIVGQTQPPLPPGVILAQVDRTKFSGLGYDASIVYKPSERLSFQFAANRNASASVNVGALSQVRTSFLVNGDYRLSSSLSLGTGASFDRIQYQGGVIVAPELFQTRVEDKINRVYANIGYTSPRLLSASFEVAYQNRKSDPPIFSFNSFTASLSLTARFGRK